MAGRLPILGDFSAKRCTLTLVSSFGLGRLPLLDRGVCQYLISRGSLLTVPSPATVVNSPILFSPDIRRSARVCRTLTLIAHCRLDLLPIMDARKRCHKIVAHSGLVSVLSRLYGTSATKDIFILRIVPRSCSVASVTHLVRTGGTRVLDLLSCASGAAKQLRLVVGVSLRSISPIVHDFRHFGCAILCCFVRGKVISSLLRRQVRRLIHCVGVWAVSG